MAHRASKLDVQDEIPRGIFKRFSFVSDIPSEMMKKEAKISEVFRKLAAMKQDRNVYKNKQDGMKVKQENMD